MSDNIFVPETLSWCNRHYVPKNDKYIFCKEFGHIDGMDGACWWCKEMTPYQWNMCADESWLNSLLNPYRKNHYKSKKAAIKFIEKCKQRNPSLNENQVRVKEHTERMMNSYEERLNYIRKDRDKYKNRYEILEEKIDLQHYGDLEYILEDFMRR